MISDIYNDANRTSRGGGGRCKQEDEIETDISRLSPGPSTLNMLPKSRMRAKDAYDVFQQTAKELEECELFYYYWNFFLLLLIIIITIFF